MGWLGRLFGTERAPKNALEEGLRAAKILVVSGYRQVASHNNCAPSSSIPDDLIFEIYQKVGTAFRKVSTQRGEHLQAGHMNTIVLKFYQVYEKMGAKFFEEHLLYETKLYETNGLRPDYQRDLRLF